MSIKCKKCYNGTKNKIKRGFVITSLIFVLLVVAVLISDCTHTPDLPSDTTFSDMMLSSVYEMTEKSGFGNDVGRAHNAAS